MICYRDRTFCTAPCGTETCSRRFTPEVEADAERWWGGPGAPVALADMGEHRDRRTSPEPRP